MYNNMVVLLDGSETAEVVFDYAQELAGRLQLNIDLLHVCSQEEAVYMPMRRAYMHRMAEELCAQAEEVRRKYDPEEMAACIQARGHVMVGEPTEEILSFIEKNDIDLVMMATHGSSGGRDWNLGDVANTIIHSARVPIWLVPAGLRQEIVADAVSGHAMVIPLSGSRQSESALRYGMAILARRDLAADIVLLHVNEAYGVGVPGVNIPITLTARERTADQQAAMKQYLEAQAAPLRKQGANVKTEVLVGEPAEEIIDYLQKNPPQLLVMATRGKGKLNRMLFGSVTENLIRMVRVTPLLLVEGDENDN